MHICIGKSETVVEKLKSVLSQLYYKYLILRYEAKGVKFRSHQYVPDIHPITKTEFHDREDEGHVYKI